MFNKIIILSSLTTSDPSKIYLTTYKLEKLFYFYNLFYHTFGDRVGWLWIIVCTLVLTIELSQPRNITFLSVLL